MILAFAQFFLSETIFLKFYSEYKLSSYIYIFFKKNGSTPFVESPWYIAKYAP